MKKIISAIKTFFSDWGTDKWAHLGIGGLICAMVTIPFILMELQEVSARLILYFIPGLVIVAMFSVFKELIDDTGFCWKDIIAAIFGCLCVELSVIFGVVLYLLGN